MFAATSAARGVTLPVRPLARKVRTMPRARATPDDVDARANVERRTNE
jgi:hypothetical protein|tara:strand:- start:457 stop:600 length:144 start_codon:yes stop_codon:yes gene_type:complete